MRHGSLKHLKTKSLISVTLGNGFQFFNVSWHCSKSDASCDDSTASSIKQTFICSIILHNLQAIHITLSKNEVYSLETLWNVLVFMAGKEF